MDRWQSSKTDWLNALNALEAFVILLSTSTSIVPQSTITNPRYGKDQPTQLNHNPQKGLMFIYRNCSISNHKFGLKKLTIKPRELATSMYASMAAHAASLEQVKKTTHQQTHPYKVAFLVGLQNNQQSCLLTTKISTPSINSTLSIHHSATIQA